MARYAALLIVISLALGTVPATVVTDQNQVGPDIEIWINGNEIARGDGFVTDSEINVTVRASAGSEGAAIQLVSLEIDGSTHETHQVESRNVTRSFRPSISYGHHEFKAVVKDSDGGVNSFRFSVTEDTRPPHVWLTSPYETAPRKDIDDGEVVNESFVRLEGGIADVSRTVELEIVQSSPGHSDKRTSTYPSNASFSERIRLVPGTNEFSIVATDEVGNKRFYSFAIEFTDDEPPTIRINSSRAVRESRITLRANVTDNVWVRNVSFGTSNYYLKDVVDEPYSIGDEPNPVTYTKSVNLYVGENPITIIAYDQNGAKTNETVVIERERPEDYGYDPPTIALNRSLTRVVSSDSMVVRGEIDGDGLVFARLESATVDGETVDFVLIHNGPPKERVAIDHRLRIANATTSEITIEVRDQNGTTRRTAFVVNSTDEAVFEGEGSTESETDQEQIRTDRGENQDQERTSNRESNDGESTPQSEAETSATVGFAAVSAPRSRILFDTDRQLVSEIAVDGTPYRVYRYGNELSIASGIEVYSLEGRVTSEARTRRVLRAVARQRVNQGVDAEQARLMDSWRTRRAAQTKVYAAIGGVGVVGLLVVVLVFREIR